MNAEIDTMAEGVMAAAVADAQTVKSAEGARDLLLLPTALDVSVLAALVVPVAVDPIVNVVTGITAALGELLGVKDTVIDCVAGGVQLALRVVVGDTVPDEVADVVAEAVGDGSTGMMTRMRVDSATYTVPLGATTTPVGALRPATAAGPPSPL